MNPSKPFLKIHLSKWGRDTDSILKYIRTIPYVACADISQHLKIQICTVRDILQVMLAVGILRKTKGRKLQYMYTGNYKLCDPGKSTVSVITVHVMESLATLCKFQLCNHQVKSVVGVLLSLGLLHQKNSKDLLCVTLTKKGRKVLEDSKEMLSGWKRKDQDLKLTSKHKSRAVSILEYIRNSSGCTVNEILTCLNIKKDIVNEVIHVLLGFGIVERILTTSKTGWCYIYKYLGTYQLCEEPISRTATRAMHAMVSVATLGRIPLCHKGSTNLVLNLLSIGLLKGGNVNQLSLTNEGIMILENSKSMLPRLIGEIQDGCMCTKIFGLPDDTAYHMQSGETMENLTNEEHCNVSLQRFHATEPDSSEWHAFEAGVLYGMSLPIQQWPEGVNATESHSSCQVPCAAPYMRVEDQTWNISNAGVPQDVVYQAKENCQGLAEGVNATDSHSSCQVPCSDLKLDDPASDDITEELQRCADWPYDFNEPTLISKGFGVFLDKVMSCISENPKGLPKTNNTDLLCNMVEFQESGCSDNSYISL